MNEYLKDVLKFWVVGIFGAMAAILLWIHFWILLDLWLTWLRHHV